MEKSRRELVARLGIYRSEYTIARRGDEYTAEGDSKDLLRVSTFGDAVGVPGSDILIWPLPNKYRLRRELKGPLWWRTRYLVGSRRPCTKLAVQVARGHCKSRRPIVNFHRLYVSLQQTLHTNS
jgi:hypothetical protein